VSRNALIATAVLLALGAAPVRAQTFAVTLLGGAAIPDQGLADFQWDTRPKFSGGVQAMAALGPWGAGARWTESATQQSLGSAASTPEARVGTRALELIARRRLAAFGAQSLFADAAVGRTRLSYHPDHVQMDVSGSPVDVALAPIEEWSWGGGLGTERPLGCALMGGLEVGYRAFSMETAHQGGGSVVVERRTFEEWSTRFTLGWRFGS
jgi:hypothetical protein